MNILNQGLEELAGPVVFRKDYTHLLVPDECSLCEPVRGMCCRGKERLCTGVEMLNANKGDFVLLHPPREWGFRGHPSDLRQLQLPRRVGWPREPFCLPWCASRENPAESGGSEGSCLAGR